jgi:two-component system chemotaxis response regulator CheY
MYQPAQPPIAPVVKTSVFPSPTRRLSERLVNHPWTYSSALMDRGSPLQSPPRRITAQSAGILVVDDEPAVRILVGKILTSRGYLVSPATNGADALAVFKRTRPSLVMLDMRMPIMDGWGFVRALQEQDIWLPVLVMTSAEDGQNWANEIGAAGYLSKPFDYLDLVAKVQHLVPPC